MKPIFCSGHWTAQLFSLSMLPIRKAGSPNSTRLEGCFSKVLNYIPRPALGKKTISKYVSEPRQALKAISGPLAPRKVFLSCRSKPLPPPLPAPRVFPSRRNPRDPPPLFSSLPRDPPSLRPRFRRVTNVLAASGPVRATPGESRRSRSEDAQAPPLRQVREPPNHPRA
ncbi:MAG: hypothetical protein JWO30_336 [Fibrobacteres bacterium]|nr:hypothetical protein [Fibrobacterota bacterium]